MREMRKIGLLGGMSWESSAIYYATINEGIRDRFGGFHSGRIVLGSVDFAEIERLQSDGDWDQAGRLLAQEAVHLEAAGAECVLLCTNTMHKVADQIEAAITVPLLHIVDATAVAVRAAGVQRVALLGTRFTMAEPFVRERLETYGLTVLTPEDADRDVVHRIIYDELVRGEVRATSRAAFVEIIGRLAAEGAEGVILGCTEIEMLIGADDVEIPVFPTTRIHAQAAVDFAVTPG